MRPYQRTLNRLADEFADARTSLIATMGPGRTARGCAAP